MSVVHNIPNRAVAVVEPGPTRKRDSGRSTRLRRPNRRQLRTRCTSAKPSGTALDRPRLTQQPSTMATATAPPTAVPLRVALTPTLGAATQTAVDPRHRHGEDREALDTLGLILESGPRYRVRVVAGCERPPAEIPHAAACIDQIGTRLVLQAATEEDSVARRRISRGWRTRPPARGWPCARSGLGPTRLARTAWQPDPPDGQPTGGSRA